MLFDIDWQGAAIIKQKMPEAVKIYILPPSLEVLKKRLQKRGQDSEEVIAKRMNAAMTESSHYNEYDYVIINDDFDESLITLRSIILSTRSQLKLIEANHHELLENIRREAQEMHLATSEA